MSFGGEPLGTATWTEILGEIEEQLAALLLATPAYLVLNVEREDDPFVQFLAADDELTAEAAATEQIPGRPGQRRLVSPAIAASLRCLGWQSPEIDPMALAEPGGPHPNFFFRWPAADGWPAALFAELAVRTLHSVWGVEPSSVRVRSGRLELGELPGRC